MNQQQTINSRPKESKEEEACASRCYEITTADLPLSCPTAKMALWNAHPRVYLPIEAEGKAVCPYCGAQFSLKL